METNLDTIAAAIRDEHGAAVRAFNSGIEHALRCGELLIEAKDNPAIPYGGWLPWLKENTGLSERSAQRYMALARGRHIIEAGDRTASLADFTIARAEAVIKKNTPPKEFPRYKHPLATDFCCPACHYHWNGNPLAGEKEMLKMTPEQLVEGMISVRLGMAYRRRVAKLLLEQEQEKEQPQIENAEAA